LTIILTFLVLACVATRLLAVGIWLYNPLHSFNRWWMPFLVLLYCFIVVVIGFYAIEMEKEKMLRLISIFLVLGQFFLSLAITFLSPLTYMLLPWLVINPASNSYFSTAVETKNLLKLLQHFEKKMPNHIQDAFGREWQPRSPKANEPPLISHAATQAPGLIVFCGITRQIVMKLPFLIWFAEQILLLSPGVTTEEIAKAMQRWHNVSVTSEDVAAALWCAVVYIIIGCGAIFFIIHIGKLIKNLKVGWGSAALFAIIPAFHIFTPSVDQMYPTVTAMITFLVIFALHCIVTNISKSFFAFIVAGFVLGFSIFINLGFIVLLPFCIFLICINACQMPKHFRGHFLGIISFIAAFLITLFALCLLTGCNIWAVFRKSDMLRMQLYSIHTPRPYLPWVWGNLVDFFVFTGIPLTIGFMYQVTREMKAAVKEHSLSSFSPMLWAFILTFFLLLFSGKVRGEAARMWLFLTPMVVVPASIALDELGIWEQKEWAIAILTLQSLNALVLQEFLRVWGV